MDSDSDDSLLGKGPIFKRPSRAETRKKNHQKAVNDTALADDKRLYASTARMSLIKRDLEDHDAEELRARTKEMTENPKSAAERRRENLDAMEGIIYNDDDDGALDRQRRIDVAHAFDTERSTCSGVRNTISFDPSRTDGTVSFVFSEQEAMHNLEHDVLEELEKNESAVGNIVERLRIVIQAGAFPEFLMEKRLDRLVTKNGMEFLPTLLCEWLYRLALSSGLGSIQFLADSALDTFVALQKHGKIPTSVLGNLQSFRNALKCWIDIDANTAMVKSEGENLDPNELNVNRNVFGLFNMLSIWKKALPALSIEHDDREVVTKCIKSLARLGLDEAVTSSKYTFGLQTIIQEVITTLLNLIAEHFRSCKEDEDKLIAWMTATSQDVLKDVSELGPGLNGAEDADDTEAWLCHSNMLRLVPHAVPRGDTQKVSCQFKATLAIQALEACLGSTKISEILHKILTDTGNGSLLKRAEPSLDWFAIAVSYVSIKEIELQGDTIVLDGPRCLATVESALYSLQTGLLLLTDFSSKSGSEYTTEDAAMLVHVIELLETQHQELSKRLSPMGTQLHLRRADYNLNCCRQLFRFVKERLNRIASPDKQVAVQSTLTSFFTKPSNTAESP